MTDHDQGSIDSGTYAALARLTESERDCLRRRLLPQTAKEMALDLGISPHAVEKRLKMARAKLGVTSSLHAARLLALTETADRTLGPYSSDLAAPGVMVHQSPTGGSLQKQQLQRPSHLVWRIAMLATVAITAFAFFWVGAPQGSSGLQSPASSKVQQLLERDFTGMDVDRSGFIEGAEVARLPRPVFDQYDGNRDGKVTLAEMKAGTKGAFMFQPVDGEMSAE